MTRYIPMLLILFLLASCGHVQTFQATTANGKQVSLQYKEDIPDTFFPKDVKIVALGDSLTKGVGDQSNNGGYLPFLEERLAILNSVRSVTSKNFGVKGYRTTNLIKKLNDPEIIQEIEKADYVIITIGGNDMMKVVKKNFFDLSFDLFAKERTGYEKRLNNILKKIRTINERSTIVLVGLYNPFINNFESIDEIDIIIDSWNHSSKNILSRYENTIFVDISDIFSIHSEYWLSDDQFHPNQEGYKRMADQIFLAIANEHFE
jgi:lysophospholipase L1-like esterase